MSPMLRGEALPLPAKELAELRDGLDRHYGDRVVPTSAGPLIAIRVPHGTPDFLRDLEAAVDVMPYRDLKGFRGVLLVGDRQHMGVSVDMLRSLLEARESTTHDWIARLRGELGPGEFHLGRIPTDPQRRLRAVFRVEVDSVTQLDEPDFDDFAEHLPNVKAASPGQVRPAFVYLVAHEDHVQLDGGAFFTDLEARRRRRIDTEEAKRRMELEERHEIALAHLERIEERQRRERRAEFAPRDGDAVRRTPARAPNRPDPLPPPPVDVPRGVPPRRDRPSSSRQSEAPRRASTDLSPRQPDRFAAMTRFGDAAEALRGALDRAGYKTKERVLVRDLPFAFAAARPDHYPTRVLVTFQDALDADTANQLLLVGRTVGTELILVVTERVDPAAAKLVLATNVKVLAPDDVEAVRFG